MTITTTRRAVIAGAAAVPLLPAAALAASVTLPLLPVASYAQPAENDPVIPVFRKWQEAFREHERICAGYVKLERRFGVGSEEAGAFETATVMPASDRRNAVEARIAQMIPTTLAGLAVQLTVAVASVDAHWGAAQGDTDCRLLLSMLAGAERMAGEGMS